MKKSKKPLVGKSGVFSNDKIPRHESDAFFRHQAEGNTKMRIFQFNPWDGSAEESLNLFNQPMMASSIPFTLHNSDLLGPLVQ